MIKAFDDLFSLPLKTNFWEAKPNGDAERVFMDSRGGPDQVRLKSYTRYPILVTRKDFHSGTWWLDINSREYVEFRITCLQQKREKLCKKIDDEIALWQATLGEENASIIDPKATLGDIIRDLNTHKLQ